MQKDSNIASAPYKRGIDSRMTVEEAKAFEVCPDGKEKSLGFMPITFISLYLLKGRVRLNMGFKIKLHKKELSAKAIKIFFQK